MIRLIVGLGNPGKQYVQTRHNMGFLAVDKLASKHEATFEAHSRIPALVATWKTKDVHWIVLKPVTFMNLSGQAVTAAMNFWKVDIANLLIVVDDTEVDPGFIRLRPKGSAGGHNGLKSIIEYLKTNEFARLRIGIGRPPDSPPITLSNWVLQPFEKSELLWFEQSINKTVYAIETWAQEGSAIAMNQHNTRNEK